MTDVLIFDVGLGQSIFVYPHLHPEYGMMIDCGHTGDFHPIDFLIEKGFIHEGTLGNLLVTNYDHDHFSGIQNLRERVAIKTVRLAKNLTSTEIKQLKDEITPALEHMCHVKDTYTNPANDHLPPYKVHAYHLEQADLMNPDTNNLSQIAFIEEHGTVICVSGDLEEKGWLLILEKHPEIKDWLKRTNVFIASHHGRENGYCSDVFSHCSPECIIISDKGIIHDTQRDMCSQYGTHVTTGINLYQKSRKVLTTRDDGHIWIRLHPDSTRSYATFSHE